MPTLSSLAALFRRRGSAQPVAQEARDEPFTDHLHGSEALVAAFGYWPSFHDAEIFRVVLERADAPNATAPAAHGGPTLQLDVWAFDTTPDVDEHGKYQLRTSVRVAFRFDDVADVRLDNFNVQNVLFGLQFAPVKLAAEPARAREVLWPELIRLEVTMLGCFGLGGSFLCSAGRVLSVEPWPPPSEK